MVYASHWDFAEACDIWQDSKLVMECDQINESYRRCRIGKITMKAKS